MIGHSSQLLANGLTSTLVVELSQNGYPTVLEEVERCLSVKGEHGQDVGRVHAVTRELDAEARRSLGFVRHGLSRVRDSHDAFLSTSVNSSVRLVGVRDPFNLGGNTDRVSLLKSVNRHVVCNNIIGEVHVLVEEGLELVACVETLSALVWQDQFPHELSFAHGAQCLILGSIKVRSVLRKDTVCVWIPATIFVSLVVSPVVVATICAGDLNLRLLLFGGWLFLTTLLLDGTSDAPLASCIGVFLAINVVSVFNVFNVFNRLVGVSLINLGLL